MSASAHGGDPSGSLIEFVLTDNLELTFVLSTIPILIIVILGIGLWFLVRWLAERSLPDFECEGAELGLGDQKISFKPNYLDRQIAYSIWVELSTRKIGLEIDLQDDVIDEIYDSWYSFFGVTRELIKDIPVSKLRRKSTRQIVSLSIELLNLGLRPHLTRWQARFRQWYGKKKDNRPDISPQELQQNFPEYEALTDDLLRVNATLQRYRARMYELVTGEKVELSEIEDG